MKKNLFQTSVQFAIEIKTTAASVLKPKELHLWELNAKNTPKHLQNIEPHAPFKFYTDAILAVCYHKMTDYKHVSSENKDFVKKAYETFDHYTELYEKSAPRVRSLNKTNLQHKKHCEAFEQKVTAAWAHTFTENKVCFSELTAVLNHIGEFETQTSSPLIYNFGVYFSAAFTEKLICFYSFLFHLRSVVAVDHNAHVEDTSHETVKCDSISDYLPKSDYTVNDALLYWHFKKLSAGVDASVEKKIITPMNHHFLHYNHNACKLIDQLPTNFFDSLADVELEDALHHVQMDWLLGSSTGLLFKVREELFGLLEGYDKIFWHESAHGKNKKASTLTLSFQLTDKDIRQPKIA